MKSRLGCGQCKRSRIKCDETPPRCGHCTRKGLECDYKDFKPVCGQVELLTPASFQRLQASPVPITPPSDAILCSVPDYPEDSLSFSSKDLGLMHCYTLYTAPTLGIIDDEEYHVIYRDKVPRLAGGYPFLMHAVLAIAAAHIAISEPAQSIRHFKFARHHYSRALIMFTASSESIGPLPAEVLFTFCNLVMLISVGLESGDPLDGCSPVQGFANVLNVIRGAIDVLAPVEEELHASPVAGLLRHKMKRDVHPVPHKLTESLNRLHELNGLQSRFSNPADVAILEDAIVKLRQFYTLVHPRPATWAHILKWPTSLSSGFFKLLEQHNAAALAVFSFWIVPVHHGPTRWFIGRWAEQAMLAISKRLQGSVWSQAIEWPLAQFG